MDYIERAWQRVCMWIGCTPEEKVDTHEDYKTIKMALEKQKSIKVVEVRNIHDFNGNVILKDGYCPMCKNELNSIYLFCNRCGQKLDWSEAQE